MNGSEQLGDAAPVNRGDAGGGPIVPRGGARPEGATSADALLARRLFADHPQPMLVYDVERLDVVDVNHAFTESYGFARDDVLGRPVAGLLPAEDAPALLERIAQVVRPGRPPYRPPTRWRHVWKDGQVRDVDVSSHDTVFAGREAVVVMIADVTDHLRAERERDALLAQLRHEDAQKAAILEQMGDAVLVADPAGRIILANRAARVLLDFDGPEWPDFVHETLPWRLYDPSGRLIEPAERPLARALTGETVHGEYRIATDRGHDYWVWITAGPLRDADGAITGIVWLGRDTTEARHRRLREAEGEKLRALGQMASGVAHDLNQYLGLVAGYADIALRSLAATPPDPAAARDALNVLARAAMDGSQTVNRLMAFAQPVRDGPPESVDVGRLLRDVAAETAPLWQQPAAGRAAPIALTVDADDAATVRGWATALRDALRNLVVNAIDAMPDGGTLRLTAHAAGDRVLVTVADSGTGIAAESLAHVFEPFFTTKGRRGTGLGLAIAYSVVEHHQGTIEVTSSPGRGTTVALTLPARAAAPPPVRTAPRAPAAAGLRVLAVDDEPAITRMVAMMLAPHGTAVTTAASAEEALAILDAAPPFDVILSDLGLGAGMDGWALLAEVRRRGLACRFVLSTGWGAQIDPSEVVARGGDALLAKPYRLPDLQAAILGTA